MAFIDKVLQEPAYGWANEQNELVVPTLKQLYGEAFRRINIFKTRKNWISLISWFMAVCMLPFLYFFIFEYFTIKLLVAFIIYSMIIMSTHGTIWFHRYCTHKAFTFSRPIWRFLTQNLVLRTFPEEMYVVSHHVHHIKCEKPGDPYNAYAGLMYCMLSDVNHHSIAKDLPEEDYEKASRLLDNSGIKCNNFSQYRKWGSIVNPFYTVFLWLANWAFWYGIFYLAGGNALACTLFSAALFWFIFVRAFNYTGHGKGKAKHVDGVDFDRSNLSLNQTRPGWFSGE